MRELQTMKNQLFAILGLLLSSTTFAQTPVPTLAQNMDSISGLVKTITKNVSDSAQNANSASAAGQLVNLFTTVLNQVPKSVKALPVNQQAAALSGYQALIQKEIADAHSLQNAFL